MPHSTVRREKLFRAWHLVAIVAVFAIAFAYLAPGQRALLQTTQHDPDRPIDPLTIAYLKARQGTETPSAVEVKDTVVALLRDGHTAKARELLEVYPALTLNARDRFLLDLELAASGWYQANASADVVATESAASQLEQLLRLPDTRSALRAEPILTRSLELSQLLGDAQLRYRLYRQLANLANPDSVRWWERCGDEMAASGQHAAAIDCYREYLALTVSPSIDVQLALLKQLHLVEDRVAVASLQTQLFENAALAPQDWKQLAELLLAINQPDPAYRAYARLAELDAVREKQWWEAAARWAQAADQPAQAALYLRKALAVSSADERPELEQRMHALLLAADDQETAMTRLRETVALYPDDLDALRRAIAVSRQLGDESQALQWNVRVLDEFPDDAAALALQLELTLATGDLSAAKIWGERLLGQRPDDPEVHRQLAKITEWNGDPETATQHWYWLAQRESNAAAVGEVVRLARMTWQPQLSATALRQYAQKHRLSTAEIRTMVESYELEGRPDLAAIALRELQSTHGSSVKVQRELARLHYRHKQYQPALRVWQQVRESGDQSSEVTLQLMELHWRLNQPEQAMAAARTLSGESVFSTASEYQVRLASELAWRYRDPALGLLVQSGLRLVQDEASKQKAIKRLIEQYKSSDQYAAALSEAVKLWRHTRHVDDGLMAMSLAVESRDFETLAEFMVDSDINQSLHHSASYWTQVADYRLQSAEPHSAEAAYHQALKLDQNNVAAVAGLLWLYVGSGDRIALERVLDSHSDLFHGSPELWVPVAVATMSAGEPVRSLSWFQRSHEKIKYDYALMLTYADALEFSGRAHDAVALRDYVLRELRPLLAQGSQRDHDRLLKQYLRAVNRYQSAAEASLSARLLVAQNDTVKRDFWRADLAIAWLMATSQHEHARLVMTQLHQHRLQQPGWQSLALAMQSDDIATVTELLNRGEGISVGDQLLALRQLGRDQEAWQLAQTTLNRPTTLFDRSVASSQYLQLRVDRPRLASMQVNHLSIDGLDVRERGVNLRHTLTDTDLGFGLDLRQRRYQSQVLNLAGREVESDLAVSLFAGDRIQSWRVTGGFLSNDRGDESYASAGYQRRNRRGTRGVSAELFLREEIEGAPELRLAARQDRGSVAVDQALGSQEFLRLQADVSRISSRLQKNLISRGLGLSAEVGVRGAQGSHRWSSSLQLQSARNDREPELPAELLLQDSTRMDSVLLPRTSSIALAFKLQRGMDADLIAPPSPRYFLQANIGHYWPEQTFALQLDAGAGFRILGGDELGFSLSHDARPVSGDAADATQFGVNYRYHF